jgi:hypothetical protein
MIRAAALLLLALAGCSDNPASHAAAKDDVAAAEAAKTIPCALDDSVEFKPVCTVADSTVDGQLYWIVRHPDGGFRRFQMIDNGTRIATADGADEVEMTRAGAEFIVKAGPDRYRFPAAPEAPASSPAASSAPPK